MSAIARATLVADTLVPLGRGTRGAHLCSVDIDGRTLRAFVKPLSAEQIAAECFCALLFAQWGVSSVWPALVEVKGKDWFCAADAGYPDLKKRFLVDEARSDDERKRRTLAAMLAACDLPTMPRALVIDEAIGNCDRNLENILWDGGQDAVWIDHERSLGLEGDTDCNHLATMAIAIRRADDIQRKSMAHALTIAQNAVDAVASELPGSHDFAHFVRSRLRRIGNRVFDRFPASRHDLFSDPP